MVSFLNLASDTELQIFTMVCVQHFCFLYWLFHSQLQVSTLILGSNLRTSSTLSIADLWTLPNSLQHSSIDQSNIGES